MIILVDWEETIKIKQILTKRIKKREKDLEDSSININKQKKLHTNLKTDYRNLTKILNIIESSPLPDRCSECIIGHTQYYNCPKCFDLINLYLELPNNILLSNYKNNYFSINEILEIQLTKPNITIDNLTNFSSDNTFDHWDSNE